MKKTGITFLLLALISGHAAAQGASQQFSAGSTHIVQGSGQLASGSVQGLSAVAAVPFAASGAIGRGSTRVANDLNTAAKYPIGHPLPVSDETIVTGPSPAEAF